MQRASKTYWLFFAASLASLLGSSLFAYSVSWHLLAITSKKLSVGLGWTLMLGPGLFLLPALGPLLERFNPKKIFIGLEVAKLIIFSLGILTTYTNSSLAAFAVTVTFGAFFSSFYPLTYICLKLTSDGANQSRRSNLYELAIQLASIGGVILAGALFEKLGFSVVLAVSILFSVVALVFILPIEFEKYLAATKKWGGFFNAYREFGVTVRSSLKSKGGDKRLLGFGMIHQFPQNVILISNIPLVLYVSEVMQKGPFVYSLLDSVFCVGGILAALLATRHSNLATRKFLPYLGLATVFILALISTLPAHGVLPFVLMFFLAVFIVMLKLQARGLVLMSYSTSELNYLSPLFQMVSSLFLLLGCFLFSALGEIVSPLVSYASLAAIIFVYTAAAVYMTPNSEVVT